MGIIFHILSDALLQHDSKVSEHVNFGMFCVIALPHPLLWLSILGDSVCKKPGGPSRLWWSVLTRALKNKSGAISNYCYFKGNLQGKTAERLQSGKCGIEEDCWDKSERILKCTWTQTHGKVRLFDSSHDADFGSASMRAHLSDLQINSVYGECIQSLHFRSLRNS